MKTINQFFLGLLGSLMVLNAQADGGFTAGQRLTEAQINSLGDMPEYKVGKMRVQVLPPPHSDGQLTLLINSKGVVGVTRNQVMVAEAKPDDQQTVEQTQPRPTGVQYNEQTRILVSTYADFGQTVDALSALKTALPDAKIGLPVVFSQQAPY